jgi:hypothetical protein
MAVIYLTAASKLAIKPRWFHVGQQTVFTGNWT